ELQHQLATFEKMIADHGEQAGFRKKYGACFTELQERAADLALALEQKNADAVATVLSIPLSGKLTNAKRPDCGEELIAVIDVICALRDEYKDCAKTLSGFTTDEIREAGRESAAILRLLYEVLCLFDQKYTAAKRERDVAEFGDVSRAAYRLLVDETGAPTPLALSLREAYDAIYVDEYQDVDAMQDATFRAISTPKNRFMVGDIKQSIYRFRGADPAVFTGYRRAFPDLDQATENDDAATVFMSDCFRCDENIIRFSNAVSGYLFRERAESIGYRSADDLCFSKPLPHDGYVSPKCRVLIYDDEEAREAEKQKRKEGAGTEGEGEDTQSKVISECEAEIIAREIVRLLNGEKKADGTPIVPGDIAVLSRSASFAAPLAARLKALHVPVNDTSKENFFENPEVLCMYALLATIDNPFRDVYLAAVLRSPLFGFTLEELVAVRGAADTSFSLYEALAAARDTLKNVSLTARIKGFLDKLALYREKAELLPVDKLLRYLYADTAVLALAEG
ncbi:MAG: UvrD-helicase domain-containing protein, partial [Clostridia bacterium]|nr:UvrD-helicase domain-containing protein [Clostridia bacterium]